VSSLCIGIGLSAFLLSFTPLILRSTTSVNGVIKNTYGTFYPFFGAYFLCCVSYSLFLLARKLRVMKGIERLQVHYVFLGVAINALGGTITNLIIPLAFHSSRFSPYGPLFGILMIGLIAHAIIRYRLMNIRLVIRRGVAYLLAVAIAGGVFVFLVWPASGLFVSQPRDLPLEIQLALVLLIAILFQPVRGRVQAWLDRYLFREPYDYQRTVREVSRTMGGILDLHSLLEYACEAIGNTVRPESVAVYTKGITEPVYRQLAAHRSIEGGEIQEQETVHSSSPLVSILSKEKRFVLRDELGRTHPGPETHAALEHLRRLGGHFALPILEDGQLTGFFLVGPKLSGDPYFAEDIDLVYTLVSQAAIAIKNALLYGQVVLVNEYVENILATIESGVISVDADGTITLFNHAAERMIGLGTKEIKGGPVRRLPATLAAQLEATLNDGKPRLHLETTLPDTRGRLTPVVSSTTALRDQNGVVQGVVVVFSDLTRLKELEGEKRRAERLASLGALAAGIAHEIKNPLVAIRTFAELLPERFTETDFREEFSRVVVREIERMDALAARLRSLATPPTQQIIPLDLRVPIEETLSLLRVQMEQARITVKRTYEGELPSIYGDPAQLKQLSLNIFMNALAAMAPGGELSIRLAPRDAFGSQTLVVQIMDTGTGIPEELMGQIFDPFVTTKPGGSGLGLSICRGIADAHRASIRARNNPGGKGTTITIEFPVVQPIPAEIYTP
jgi:PAS domain S-box-containing protein